MIKRGHIYWASLPGDKRRPVLVVSPDARNDKASDIIVAPISTVLRQGPWHVRLRKGEGGIPQTSIVKCEQITTLRKEVLSLEPLGASLTLRQMTEVERAILRAIGIPIWE